MNSLKVFTLALFSLALFSCEKTDMPSTSALVLDYGDVLTDGCGFLILLGEGTDAELVRPMNLPANFQKDSVELLVDFVDVEEQFTCGLMGISYNQVRLMVITEKP